MGDLPVLAGIPANILVSCKEKLTIHLQSPSGVAEKTVLLDASTYSSADEAF